ncbi:MAG: hypothetical protein L0Y66_10120 [Myxococcaceae bacterium]|nr:hypothetical protein [Myxococcaceae bacterium]MCI0671481.1 hypothetical protein [Myxococcaceae bacterium]
MSNDGDNCAAGLYCAMETDGGPSAHASCRRFCATSNECAPGSACLRTLVRIGTPERPGLCTPTTFCDPLAQDCPASQGCYLIEDVSACRPEGAVAPGAPCELSADCVRGSGCFENLETGVRTCLAFCSTTPGGGPSCTTGTCVQPQRASVGACFQ